MKNISGEIVTILGDKNDAVCWGLYITENIGATIAQSIKWKATKGALWERNVISVTSAKQKKKEFSTEPSKNYFLV